MTHLVRRAYEDVGKSQGTYKERSQYSCNYNERVKPVGAFNFDGKLVSETRAPDYVSVTHARRRLVCWNVVV